MAREEKPHIPPERKPVSEFPAPSPAVVLYTELVNRTDAAYVKNAPVARGTLYSSMIGANQDVISTYPNLYFLKERKFGPTNDQLVLWDWATVPEAEDTYNAEVDYVSNAVPYPAFTRVYTIRRDDYDASPTLTIGSTLTGLIGVTIVDGGGDYTQAKGTINNTDVEIEFVIQDGVIVSGVITNEGTGILATSTIIVTGDGSGAVVTPIVQKTNCYLTKQKKQELPDGDPLRNEFVRVIRVYETLPGPFIGSTRIDVDGVVIYTNTRRNIANNITSDETLVGVDWTKTTKKGDDNFVAEEIVETRVIPGNPMPTSRLDDDGKEVTLVITFKNNTPDTTAETLIAGVWKKIHQANCTSEMGVSDLVIDEVVESRAIPGNPVPSSRLDDDGVAVSIVTTLKDTTAITTQETLAGGTWTKTTKKEVSDLVAHEIVESRAIPGNPMIKTAWDAAGDALTETRTMVAGPPTLVSTISTVGGVWTKTFGEPISDLVSWKVVQVKPTQATLDSYEAEIPDLLPTEFRPQVPVTTHEETLIGNATAITLPLALGVLMEKKEQIGYNTYRHTIRGRAGISLPQVITNKETTSQFGGGDINVTMTLDLFNNLSLDEGLTVLVPSEIRKLDDQVNGLAVKTSKILNAGSWPVLDGTHVNEEYGIVIDIQRQTVAAGTTGGLIGGAYVEVKPHDKWKSIQISSRLDPTSLPEDVQWFSGQRHSFPPVLVTGAWNPVTNPYGVVIQWAEATCGCSDSFSAVLQANMNQYTGMVKTRITEQFYNGVPPDNVAITQFFPQSHNFGFAWSSFCGTSDGNCRTKSGAPEFHIPLCLHDDFNVCVCNLITYPNCVGCPGNSWSFNATSPADLPHGTYIMLPPHVERWRFGVFRRVLTEVLVP